MTPPAIPILMYHSIDPSGSVISTSPELFRKQMKILSESSLKVISLREVASRISTREPLPENAVAITFDDGFRNLLDSAYPVLAEYGYPATIFLVTSFCGKNNQWYGQPDQIPTMDLLSWEEISKMSDRLDFGVHTANHPDLTKIAKDQLLDEIQGAREEVTRHTGKSDQAFAYPYGKCSVEARKIVEQNFFAACSTEMSFASENSDLYFLPRIDMYYFSRNEEFASIGSSRFERYVRVRQLLRQFRQAIFG